MESSMDTLRRNQEEENILSSFQDILSVCNLVTFRTKDCRMLAVSHYIWGAGSDALTMFSKRYYKHFKNYVVYIYNQFKSYQVEEEINQTQLISNFGHFKLKMWTCYVVQ
jgi:hypothetical protein